MLTKREEIEILRKAIQELGEDSYFGPWLADVCGEAEQLIKSDIIPQISIKDTLAQIAIMKANCASELDQMKIKHAEYIQREQNKLCDIARSNERAQELRLNRVREALNKTIREL